MAIAIDDIKLQPWQEARHGWRGELISADGTSTKDFQRDDVEEVILYGCTPPNWDGETAGILRLKDGRFVGWEADWGPTGDGFCRDAYGGTADLIFGSSVEAILPYLSDRAKVLFN